MRKALQSWVTALLKVPGEPHDPSGAPGTLRVFQPASSYFKYRTAVWALGQLAMIFLCLAVGAWLFMLGIAVLSKLAPGPGALAEDHHASLRSLITPEAWRSLVTSVTALVVTLSVTQAVFTFALMNLDFSLRWYKVTDRSLRIREGVWSVRELTMSFANIQNISVTQGPIQRFFGVSDLVVESAGGGAVKPGEVNLHTGYFRGVENAEEIKAMMLARLRELKNTPDTSHSSHSSQPSTASSAASPGGSMSLESLEALRGLRDEAHALRAVLVRRANT